MTSWFSPGRIEVLGKHTDYAGGRSLLAALDRGVTVTVSDAASGLVASTTAAPGAVDLARTDLEAGHWARYVQTVVARLSRNFGALPPCRIDVDSTLPLASGMSSSSALVVASALALARHHGLDQTDAWASTLQTPEDLATYLACIENGSSFGPLTGDAGVGTFGGSEDHTAMVCARDGHLAQYRFGPAVAEAYLPFPDHLSFVVCMSGVLAEKTGAARDLYNRASARAKAVVTRWNEATGHHCDSIGQALREVPDARTSLRGAVAGDAELTTRLEHFFAESETYVPAAAQALAAGDLTTFGREVADSHRAAAEMLGNVVPQTQALVDLALADGAHAASAFGAGFGGSVWALVDSEGSDAFAGRWLDAYASQHPDHAGAASAVAVHPAGPTREV